MADGKGGRLRPLTLHTPKPIVPLASIPFLFFQIDHIKRAGITEVILSLSYQPRKISEIFGDGMSYGVTLRYTYEDLPRGTAGAFKAAENLIDDTTVVFNGDILADIGEVGEALYLVVQGEIALVVDEKKKEYEIVREGPGEMLGIMSFFDRKPRSVRLVARAPDTQGLRLSRAMYRGYNPATIFS